MASARTHTGIYSKIFSIYDRNWKFMMNFHRTDVGGKNLEEKTQ